MFESFSCIPEGRNGAKFLEDREEKENEVK